MAGGFNKAKGIKALAWISFGFGAVAGTAAAGTFFGDWIAGALGFGPNWLPTLVFVGVCVAMAVDLFVDSEPNQIALYSAMALPSLARSVPGQLGATVTNLSHQLLAQVNTALGSWLGVTSSLATAVVCAAVALLMARRVIRKGR